MAQCVSSLNRLGNLFELDFSIDGQRLSSELLQPSEQWQDIDPQHPEWRVQRLDLQSSAVATNDQFQFWCQHFPQGLEDICALRFGPGSYLPPHRENLLRNYEQTCQLIVPLRNLTSSSFAFIYDDRFVPLRMGVTYFVNPAVRHCMFGFNEGIFLLKAKMRANPETLRILKRQLAEH